jgi:hypothetical protein
MQPPRTAFFIFLSDYSLLHAEEYAKYSMLTAAASVAWRVLDAYGKQAYEEKSNTEKELYKLLKRAKTVK